MSEKWNPETITKFVKELKKHECLWNVNCESCKNRQMRESACQQIVEAMNIVGFDVRYVKNRIEYLKSLYLQQREKNQKLKASGGGSKNVYKPGMKRFEEMDTLSNNVDGRTSFDNVSIQKHFIT